MTIKYRYEHKYHLDITRMNDLIYKLTKVLNLDPHSQDGSYQVTSLYFDTIFNELYYEKLEGLEKREKIRIRVYNHSDKVINLELKGKHNNGVYKQRIKISIDEYHQILNGDYDFLLNKGKYGEKFYWKFKTMNLQPKVVIDYERTAFLIPLTDIRITFDYHLKGGSNDALFKNMANASILKDRIVVLEIKGSNDIPRYVKDLVKGYGQLTANSKYALALEQIRKGELV